MCRLSRLASQTVRQYTRAVHNSPHSRIGASPDELYSSDAAIRNFLQQETKGMRDDLTAMRYDMKDIKENFPSHFKQAGAFGVILAGFAGVYMMVEDLKPEARALLQPSPRNVQ